MIGKITRVPLRDVWKHEALDFTRWLEENIDILADATGLDLATADREQAAGDFSVDLVAEDAAGNTVVVENQLERSNHDHLGKVLTYLVAFDARTAVWIVSDPRPEHVAAIAWLNESSSAEFFLLKLEAIQIGDSQPAPLLTKIVGPSEEARRVGRTKQELAGRHAVRYRFWEGLLSRAAQRTRLHSAISPSSGNWVGTSANLHGLNLNYSVVQHETRITLYIDKDRDTGDLNKEIFRHFASHRGEIEEGFGGPLSWDAAEGRRYCRIQASVSGGYLDEDRWPDIHDAAVDAMIRLEAAVRPYLAPVANMNPSS